MLTSELETSNYFAGTENIHLHEAIENTHSPIQPLTLDMISTCKYSSFFNIFRVPNVVNSTVPSPTEETIYKIRALTEAVSRDNELEWEVSLKFIHLPFIYT